MARTSPKPNAPHRSSDARTSTHVSARAVGLIVAAAWIAPCVLSLLSEQETARGRYLGNLSSLLFAPLFILLAVALGDWLLSRVFRLNGSFPGRWLFAVGLGLGLFSLDMFLGGQIVIPPAWAAWATCVALSVLLAARTGELLSTLRGGIARFAAERNWAEIALVLIIAVLLALNVLRSFVPPVEYDEMEYHLAGPAKCVRDGRISFISDNAYASFPANVEMLFLDAMVIRGGVVEGFALGRLINVSLGLLAACAAGACAAAMFGKRAALPAAAILYTWPRINSIAIVGYVELGVMLYVALAILAAYEYRRSGRRIAHLVLLGVVCGLAAGCKYPAVLFVCVPAAVWVIATAGRKVIVHVLLFGAVALAVFSPWLIRNVVCTGNPVYPLLGSVFDSPTWSAAKDVRWTKAHSPKKPPGRAFRDAALHRYPPTIRTKDGEKPGPYAMSLLLVVFIPLAFFRRGWRLKGAVLLGLGVLSVALWLSLTHQIPRFLVPWLVPLVLLNAAGAAVFAERKILSAVFGATLVALAGVEAWATIRIRAPMAELGVVTGQVDTDAAVKALKDGSTYDHDAIQFINALPEGSRALFYGEARTLYCTGDVIAPTVFDENPLDEIVRSAKSAEDIREQLRALGVTHIYVNLAELHRLQWSYASEHEGEVRHGYSGFVGDEPQRSPLPQFLAESCRIVHPKLSPRTPQWRFDLALIEEMSRHERDRFAKAPAAHFVYEIRKP